MPVPPLPPVELDALRRRMSGVLAGVVWTCAVGGTVYLAAGAAVGAGVVTPQSVGAIGSFFGSLLLLRAGRPAAAGLTTTLALFGAASFQAASLGGPDHYPSLLPLYVLCCLLGAAMLGWRAALGYAALGVIGITALDLAADRQLLPSPSNGVPRDTLAVFRVTLLLVAGIVTALVARAFEASVADLRDQAERLVATAEEVRRRVRLQSALAELGKSAVEPAADLPLLAVRVVRGVFDADHAMVLDVSGHVVAADGSGPAAGDQVPVPGSPIERALQTGLPVRIDDLADDHRFQAPAPKQFGSALLVAVPGEDRVIGVATARPHAFSSDDAAFLVSVAQLLSADTARHRALDAIRAGERRYSELVERSPDGMLWVDHDGVVRTCNRSAARLAGRPADEVLGQPLARLSAREVPALERLLERLDQTSATGEDALVEFLLERPDGSSVHVEANARPADGPDRAPGLQVVLRDVSVRRAAEEVRQQLEAQLLDARRMESIGRLAGGVAHDFNNLLTVILAGASMIEDEDSPCSPTAARIRQAGERAAALTAQLLAFARKQVNAPRVLDLGSLVRELEPLLQRVVREDIQLTLEVADQHLQVRADPSQVEQVLLNLVANARDAMPDPGRVMIRVEPTSLDDHYAAQHAGVQPGPYVLLEVTDTGRGMDARTLERIWEPFFTTRGEDGGTGLGLATVHGIVKQSHGHVYVYSEPGRGASFKVYLPQAEGRIQEAEAPAPLSKSSGETVLLVDDNTLVLDATRRILESAGYRVLAALDAEEALARSHAFAGRIDLLVTDVVLPRIGGRQLAESIRAERPGIRVLLISGYAESIVALDGELDPGTAFLQKPFGPSALIGRVRAVLDAPA